MAANEDQERADLEAAAATGDPDACHRWGLRLLYGVRRRNTPEEQKRAAPFIIQAADAGHIEAQALLARMFEDGAGGVEKDEVLSAKWYKVAAENGHSHAMVMLGYAYDLGRRGCAADNAEAVRWMRRAAEAGDTTAWRWLAQHFLRGPIQARNEAEGLRWLERASDDGRGDALCSVDWAKRLHRQGDAVGAYAMLYRAARQSKCEREEIRKIVHTALEDLSKAITAEQRREGRDRAMEPTD